MKFEVSWPTTTKQQVATGHRRTVAGTPDGTPGSGDRGLTGVLSRTGAPPAAGARVMMRAEVNAMIVGRTASGRSLANAPVGRKALAVGAAVRVMDDQGAGSDRTVETQRIAVSGGQLVTEQGAGSALSVVIQRSAPVRDCRVATGLCMTTGDYTATHHSGAAVQPADVVAGRHSRIVPGHAVAGRSLTPEDPARLVPPGTRAAEPTTMLDKIGRRAAAA